MSAGRGAPFKAVEAVGEVVIDLMPALALSSRSEAALSHGKAARQQMCWKGGGLAKRALRLSRRPRRGMAAGQWRARQTAGRQSPAGHLPLQLLPSLTRRSRLPCFAGLPRFGRGAKSADVQCRRAAGSAIGARNLTRCGVSDEKFKPRGMFLALEGCHFGVGLLSLCFGTQKRAVALLEHHDWRWPDSTACWGNFIATDTLAHFDHQANAEALPFSGLRSRSLSAHYAPDLSRGIVAARTIICSKPPANTC